MKCPIDSTVLENKEYERNIRVDHCNECNGLFLESWELKAVQANKGRYYEDEIQKMPELIGAAYLQALEKDRPLLECPSCKDKGESVEMERREHGYCSQIMIDVCPECSGIWLDKGEISALEIFFERSHMDDTEIKAGFFQHLWFWINK